MSERIDHGDNLAGQIKCQPHMNHEEITTFKDELGEFSLDFYHNSQAITSQNSLFYQNRGVLEVSGAWFVQQCPGEYNPNHHHDNCELSCIGYLEVPTSIAYGTSVDGCVEFRYGNHFDNSCSAFYVRPQVGDFYVFPNYLEHAVYPFKNGRRRSFSANIEINMNLENSVG